MVDVGDPVAVDNPVAWIQIAAVSKDQPLALGTRMRTPLGWTTVEKLTIGDLVYDEHGRLQPVQRETEVFNDLDCYRIVFDDGQEVVASAEHGWTVDRKRGHGDYHVTETLTTQEIARTYLDTKGGRRIRIPVVPVESSVDVDLPIDPYLLGLWLGDGNRNNGTIAIDWRARDEVEQILQPLLGEHERMIFTYVAGNTGVVNIRNVSRHATNGPALIQRLRKLGVLHDKHIPDSYAFASTQQRRALLQGLIDSDGCILPDGQVRFTNIDRELIDDVRDLVASLGYKAHVRGHGTAGWIVSFHPDERPVARLRHKVERQKAWSKPQPQFRYIESVERVESVPVKCIGIDTPSHLFQVEAGILTHNTRNTMTLFPAMISKKLMKLGSMRLNDIGKEIIYAYGGRRRIEAITSSPRAIEGGRPTLVIMNETHHWLENNDGHAMADVIDRNATKSEGGAARALSITNAYAPHEESVAQQEREAWEAETAGLSIQTGVLYDSLEAPRDAKIRLPRKPDGTEPTDEEIKAYIGSVVRAVRGDSYWLDIETIVKSILNRRNPPSRSRRFWYNQIVTTEDAWADAKAIKAAIDPLAADARTGAEDQLRAGWRVLPDDPIVMFGDGSKSHDATGLVGCRLSDGYVFTIGVWQKPPGDRGEGWLAPRGEVRHRIDEAFERFNVKAFWFDPSHTKDDEDGTRYWDGMLDEIHRIYKDRLQVWAVKTGDRQQSVLWDMAAPERTALFVGAAEMFIEELEHRDAEGEFDPVFFHDGHPALVQHMANAKQHPGKFGISLRKENRESLKKIDLAVCAVGARLLRRVVLNRGLEEQEPEEAGELWGS